MSKHFVCTCDRCGTEISAAAGLFPHICRRDTWWFAGQEWDFCRECSSEVLAFMRGDDKKEAEDA